MEHILDLDKDAGRLQHEVFAKIAEGNTVLFLGAGASVGEKRYLSKEIIQYYSEYKGLPEISQDIIEFVDILSKNPKFNRREFDSYVVDLLNRLSPTIIHQSIIECNWKEIITTNFDLLVERAIDNVRQKRRPTFEIKAVKNIFEYSFNPAYNEIKYVKLNGCSSDLGKYPLVFSTEDFERASRLYKHVLRAFGYLSDSINVLSIGYSFSDTFAKYFFDRFDKFNRNRRWIYSVDPFVKDDLLPYYGSKKISVIRCTAEEFFDRYNRWQAVNQDYIISAKKISFSKPNNEKIQLSRRTLLNLHGCLIQLSEQSSVPTISPAEYYQGSEPTYDVVRKSLDVVRKRESESIKKTFLVIHERQKDCIPIIAIRGSFGTGKSTFCYRLISNLLNEPEFHFAAFQIIDATKLRVSDVVELIKNIETKNIVFLFTGIELDSKFKELSAFRNSLNTEQFIDYHISIVCSIRVNILNRYFTHGTYRSFHIIDLPDRFNDEEVSDLLDKLTKSSIISIRDAGEKNTIVKRIRDDYSGDPLLALINLVSNGYHDQILRNAISQLTPKSKKAFLYTSLLYQYSIKMPAGLAKELISKDWEEFTSEVLEYDGKGILLQEQVDEKGLRPDIYLRTRHPIISQKIVSLLLPTEDEKYSEYKKIISKLIENFENSQLIVDLLKNIRYAGELSDEKINGLFDSASEIFQSNPHFNIQYAINLQNRGNEKEIEKALRTLTYVESVQDHRNHRITHRKACLNFVLAKIRRDVYGEDVSLILAEAKELFEIKSLLDPQSFYSYSDYLKMLLWQIKNIEEDDESRRLSSLVEIENVMNKAEGLVEDRLDEILRIKSEYLLYRNNLSGGSEAAYLQFLEKISLVENIAHLGAILRFNYFEARGNLEECERIILDVEHHTKYDSSLRLLIKYYGKRLQYRVWRDKLSELVKSNPRIEKLDTVRFHYYSMIMHAYMSDFQKSNAHGDILRDLRYVFNPEFIEYWKEPEKNVDKHFQGVVVHKHNGLKLIKLPILQQSFMLKKQDLKNYQLGENKEVGTKIVFQLNGIRCELLPPAVKEENAPPEKER